MPEFILHHVSIIASNLERSIEFYKSVFDLERIERPPFKSSGAWFDCGGQQLHIILNPKGTFRSSRKIDDTDWHYALCTKNFSAVIDTLKAQGFREDAAEGDPKRLVINRSGVAGFQQAYLLDPDLNIIEINGAKL
jgi:catechol 2,3-dioxygenase-like lactoylglutathione lyase family enzyme